MLTGALRNEIDKLWEKFWTGGIANPLTVIEQISYLLFARLLDMQEENRERMAANGVKVDYAFPQDAEGQQLRWKNFKHMSGADLLPHIKNKVYPFFEILFQEKNKATPGVIEYMQGADLEIKNASVLTSAITMIDSLPLGKSDIKGDIYEYLLSKLTTAGITGQFRTPRHIIDAIINLIDPQPTDIICDPACGTAGFLARTMEYLNQKHSSKAGTIVDEDGNIHYTGDQLTPYREHINKNMFWGFDFDTTMLRVSSMNMLLHDVDQPNIHFQDSLNKSAKLNYPKQQQDFFDVVLANPPFKGAIDESNTAPEILSMVKTKKTELLFVAHIQRSLKLGGRAAVIVPDGVLFGSSRAHMQLRKQLIENNQLEAVVSLPSGIFKPYAGVSTAILIFSKGGTTEKVWFFDLLQDGYSLDDKRTPQEANDIPALLEKWSMYKYLIEINASQEELDKHFADKKQQAFIVSKEDIAKEKYDLSINRYKEIEYEEVEYDPPLVILDKLEALETEIQADLKELRGML